MAFKRRLLTRRTSKASERTSLLEEKKAVTLVSHIITQSLKEANWGLTVLGPPTKPGYSPPTTRLRLLRSHIHLWGATRWMMDVEIKDADGVGRGLNVLFGMGLWRRMRTGGWLMISFDEKSSLWTLRNEGLEIMQSGDILFTCGGDGKKNTSKVCNLRFAEEKERLVSRWRQSF